MNWKGWVESRIRLLTLKVSGTVISSFGFFFFFTVLYRFDLPFFVSSFAEIFFLSTIQIERDTHGVLQCHPHPGKFSDKSKPFHHSYFMGLRRKEGANPQGSEQFDIRMTVEDFKRDVYAYSFWKTTMWIHVCHVKRKDIPIFVFPSGVRPSPPARGSSESRSVQKSPNSNSPQADAFVGRRKRKQEEVNRVSITESSSTGMCISDAASFDETNGSKKHEPDISGPTSNGGFPGNIFCHTPVIAGFDQSKSAPGPTSSSGSLSGSLAMDKHVSEQPSAQTLDHDDSSVLLDGLVEGVQLKNEIQHNGEIEGINTSVSFTTSEQAVVGVAGDGKGPTTSSEVQQNSDLEELEVLSANFFKLYLYAAKNCMFLFS